MGKSHFDNGLTQKQGRGWLKSLNLLPIPIFIALIIIFVHLDLSTVFEPPYLLLILNILFLTIIPFVVAYLAWRGYDNSNQTNLIFIGCGMIAFGFGSLLAGFSINTPGGINLTPAIHNTGALMGAILLCIASIFSLKKSPQSKIEQHRAFYLALLYLAVIVSILLFAVAAYQAVIPPFFVQGTGPTILRQIILGTATILFAISSVIFLRVYFRSRSDFAYWFSIAQILIAAGLCALFLQKNVGGLIGWTGRAAQYLAGVYLLIGIISAYSASKVKRISLEIEFSRSFNYIDTNYKTLFEMAPNAIISVDNNSSILTWNPAAASIFGYTAAEAVSAKIDFCFPPENGLLLINELQKLAKTRGQASAPVKKLEITARRKQGEDLPVEVAMALKKIAGVWIGTLIISDISERKQAAIDLARQKEEYRTIFDSVRSAIAYIDRDGRILRVNKACASRFGLQPDEMIGKTFYQIFPNEEADKLTAANMDVINSGVSKLNVVDQYTTPTGEIRWASTDRILYEGNEGNVAGIILVIQDFTRRKQAEDSLHERNRDLNALNSIAVELASIKPDSDIYMFIVLKLKILTNIATAAFGIYDRQKREIKIISEEIELSKIAPLTSALGIKKLTEARFPISDEIRNDLIQNPVRIEKSLNKITFGVIPTVIGQVLQRAQGIDRFVEIAYVLDGELYGTSVLGLRANEPDPSLEILSSFASLIAVTLKRKQAEDALLQSEQKYRLIVENSRDIIVTFNSAGEFEYVSPAITNVLGYSQSELIGRNYRSFIHTDDLLIIQDAIKRNIENPYQTPVTEYRVKHANGEWRWHAMRGSAVRGTDGKFINFTGTANDITERRQAEELLVRILLELAQGLITESEIDIQMRHLCQTVVQSIKCDRSSIFIVENGYYQAKYNYGNPEDIARLFPDFKVPLDSPLIATVFNASDHIIVINNAQTSTLFNQEFAKAARIKAIAVAAIFSEDGSPLGFITAEYNEQPGEFSYIDSIIIKGIAKYVEVVVRINNMNMERIKADEAILHSKMLLQNVIDTTADWMYVKDVQHRYLMVNKSFAKAQNLAPQDMIGKVDLEFFDEELCLGNPDKGIQGFHVDDDDVFQGKTIHNTTNLTTWADGSHHYYDTYKMPLTDASGKIYGALCYGRDVTERKMAEDKLELSYDSTKKTLKGTVDVIGVISEIRDPYTAGHQRRVAQLSVAIAAEMDLTSDQIDYLQTAAVLHDTGKMYIPSDILTKPGKLTEIEFGLIKTHAQGSYDILKGIDFNKPVAQIALQHHERMDGSGYPNKLKGDEILLEARIVAVADVIEAMASHRPYRAALGIDKALEEISGNKGKLYDPDVVDACIKVFGEKGFKFDDLP